MNQKYKKSITCFCSSYSNFLFIFFLFIGLSSSVTFDHDRASNSNQHTSIVYKTLIGSTYSFDVYTLPLRAPPSVSNELRLTDGHSLNFNGHFPTSSSLSSAAASSFIELPPDLEFFLPLIYVTERNGTSSIYLDALYYENAEGTGRRSLIDAKADFDTRIQVPLVGPGTSNGKVSMKDRPTLVGDCLIYISTHEDPGISRASWAAVYSTQLTSGITRRLTPHGVADFSPAVSPSGEWTAVASYGEKGWGGDVTELKTDIYVFLTRDGSNRVKVVEHGGWPTWSDDSTFYFHRVSDDGWWSVYRVKLSASEKLGVEIVMLERVTPAGLHVFTPAASAANKDFIAVATRRPTSQYRHVELYDVVAKEFRELTRAVSPNANHYNPFVSPDFSRVGYHRCRGTSEEDPSKTLLLENFQNPLPEISLFQIDGSFPSFSPTGDRIAFQNSRGLYVVNSDGSGIREVLPGSFFTTAWDRKRKGVMYTSVGPIFASEGTEVDIISVNVDEDKPTYKKLTRGGKNNAFPWPSPDGKWVVFRSGRTGNKNLYIMEAINGESGGLRRLTDGPWTDTMCNWSPDGEWIAFASDRDNPDSGSFALYMIHPNGTGLKKLFQSGSGGRANHPHFSPDAKSVVFTSDYGGVSAEPISVSHHFQPYGEIFTMNLDGSDLRRLTHNTYEDGTPAWGPKFIKPINVDWPNGGTKCDFDDCRWLNTTSKLGMENDLFVATRVQCSNY